VGGYPPVGDTPEAIRRMQGLQKIRG